MRCSCKVCGPEIWMVQADSARLGCVCTVCGYRCNDCLGTDTVVPRDRVAALAADPRFSPDRLSALFRSGEGEEPAEDPEADSVSAYEKDGGW